MALHMTRTGVALTVGIILVTGLVIAGLFIVKNSGEQARREEAILIAEQNLESQSGNDVALNEGDKDKNSDNPNSTGGDSETANGPQTVNIPESNGSQPNGDYQSSELPQTGPSDPISLLIVGIMTLSVTTYLASRRQISA